MAWAEIIDGRISIGCSTVENHLATQLPGCNFDKKTGVWHAPLSWATVATMHMLWHGQQLDRGPELTEWSTDAYQDVMHAWSLRSALNDNDDADGVASCLDEFDEASIPFPDGRPRHLYPFQRGGAVYLSDRRRGILGDEQGQGKTAQLIRALQLARALGGVSGDPLPALVVCTVAAIRNWEREFANWAPELRTVVVDGTALRRRQAIERDDTDVWIVGWPNVKAHTRLAAYPGVRFVRCKECGGIDDGIPPARCEVHAKELNLTGRPWRTVIADEAHRMQDARSKQTRALWWLLHQAEYRWLATGTPIGDNIGQLWPLLHGLDPASAPSRSRYLDLFAVKEINFHGGSTVLGIRPDTAETFHSFVQPMIRRVPRAVALPFLPKRLEPVFRYPEMSPAQKRVYDKIKKQALAELEGRLVVAQNDLVSFTRLCQLASSMLEVTEGEDADGFTVLRPKMIGPSSKVADLLDFLEDEDGQLVVAANSPQLVEMAEKALAAKKITHCKIVGGMSADDMDQAVTWFQDGKCRVIFITAAGAESITLTAAHTIFFMQPDPSWRSREQKISRIDRIGQQGAPTGGIRVVYSITPKSVEERLFQLGEEKGERAEQVTRDADMLRWLIGGERGEAQQLAIPEGSGDE